MRKSESTGWDPAEYDKWYEKEPGKTIDLIETECVLSLLIPVNGKKILDVGCGTGNFTKKLTILGYDVLGIEPDDAMRETALRKGLNCIKGWAEDIPFEDESFDAVISVASAEFFEDLNRALEEMLRVTRNGGKVVIGFITGPWADFYRKKGGIFERAKFPKLEKFSHFAKEIKFCLRTPPGSEVNFDSERSFMEPGFACVLIEKRV